MIDQTDKEIDILLNEIPQKHGQIDGKINNVTFKTARLKTWKTVIVKYFGEAKTTIQNQKTCDTLILIQIKITLSKLIFSILGLLSFKELNVPNFESLKSECDMFDSEETNPKFIVSSPKLIRSKSTQDLANICDTPEFKTPTRNFKHQTPAQKRVIEHSKSMDQKFNEIHTSLNTLDLSMQNFVEKLVKSRQLQEKHLIFSRQKFMKSSMLRNQK